MGSIAKYRILLQRECPEKIKLTLPKFEVEINVEFEVKSFCEDSQELEIKLCDESIVRVMNPSGLRSRSLSPQSQCVSQLIDKEDENNIGGFIPYLPPRSPVIQNEVLPVPKTPDFVSVGEEALRLSQRESTGSRKTRVFFASEEDVIPSSQMSGSTSYGSDYGDVIPGTEQPDDDNWSDESFEIVPATQDFASARTKYSQDVVIEASSSDEVQDSDDELMASLREDDIPETECQDNEPKGCLDDKEKERRSNVKMEVFSQRFQKTESVQDSKEDSKKNCVNDTVNRLAATQVPPTLKLLAIKSSSSDGSGPAGEKSSMSSAVVVKQSMSQVASDPLNDTANQLAPTQALPTRKLLAIKSSSNDGSGSAGEKSSMSNAVVVKQSMSQFASGPLNDTANQLAPAQALPTLKLLAIKSSSNDGSGSAGEKSSMSSAVVVKQSMSQFASDPLNDTANQLAPTQALPTLRLLAIKSSSNDGSGSTGEKSSMSNGVVVKQSMSQVASDPLNDTANQIAPTQALPTLKLLAIKSSSNDGSGSTGEKSSMSSGVVVKQSMSQLASDPLNDTANQIAPTQALPTLKLLAIKSSSNDGSGSTGEKSSMSSGLVVKQSMSQFASDPAKQLDPTQEKINLHEKEPAGHSSSSSEEDCISPHRITARKRFVKRQAEYFSDSDSDEEIIVTRTKLKIAVDSQEDDCGPSSSQVSTVSRRAVPNLDDDSQVETPPVEVEADKGDKVTPSLNDAPPESESKELATDEPVVTTHKMSFSFMEISVAPAPTDVSDSSQSSHEGTENIQSAPSEALQNDAAKPSDLREMNDDTRRTPSPQTKLTTHHTPADIMTEAALQPLSTSTPARNPVREPSGLSRSQSMHSRNDNLGDSLTKSASQPIRTIIRNSSNSEEILDGEVDSQKSKGASGTESDTVNEACVTSTKQIMKKTLGENTQELDSSILDLVKNLNDIKSKINPVDALPSIETAPIQAHFCTESFEMTTQRDTEDTRDAADKPVESPVDFPVVKNDDSNEVCQVNEPSEVTKIIVEDDAVKEDKQAPRRSRRRKVEADSGVVPPTDNEDHKGINTVDDAVVSGTDTCSLSTKSGRARSSKWQTRVTEKNSNEDIQRVEEAPQPLPEAEAPRTVIDGCVIDDPVLGSRRLSEPIVVLERNDAILDDISEDFIGSKVSHSVERVEKTTSAEITNVVPADNEQKIETLESNLSNVNDKNAKDVPLHLEGTSDNSGTLAVQREDSDKDCDEPKRSSRRVSRRNKHYKVSEESEPIPSKPSDTISGRVPKPEDKASVEVDIAEPSAKMEDPKPVVPNQKEVESSEGAGRTRRTRGRKNQMPKDSTESEVPNLLDQSTPSAAIEDKLSAAQESLIKPDDGDLCKANVKSTSSRRGKSTPRCADAPKTEVPDIDTTINGRPSRKRKQRQFEDFITDNTKSGTTAPEPSSRSKRLRRGEPEEIPVPTPESLPIETQPIVHITVPSNDEPKAKRTKRCEVVPKTEVPCSEADDFVQPLVPPKPKGTPRGVKQDKPPLSNKSFDNEKSRRCSSEMSNDSVLGVNRATKWRIIFTGVDSHANDLAAKFKLKVVDNPNEANILVAVKFSRTVKMMYAVGKGMPIVSVKWLEDSSKANTVLDVNDYTLVDEAAERKFQFNLAATLRIAAEEKIFDGWQFFITKSCAPNPKQMSQILSGCNAKVITKKPSKFNDKTVIVSCTEDVSSIGASKVPIVSVEFILMGILRQTIDLTEYKL